MKKAVLIIHGFVGSLLDNEYLMNYLNLDSKFDVFARTLPGHYDDTNYQKAEFKEWIDFSDKMILDLINYGYKKIYVIGHSMGGVLAGYVASKYKEVKKVVFLNAAYTYLNLKQNKIDILEHRDYKNYIEVFDRVLHTSIPFFLEFTKLVKEYHDVIKNITTEALVLQSTADQVVPVENGIEIYNNLKGIKYLTFMENDRHMIFGGNSDNLLRKEELAHYIDLFLRGGLKWKRNWKEKI